MGHVDIEWAELTADYYRLEGRLHRSLALLRELYLYCERCGWPNPDERDRQNSRTKQIPDRVYDFLGQNNFHVEKEFLAEEV